MTRRNLLILAAVVVVVIAGGLYWSQHRGDYSGTGMTTTTSKTP